MGKITIKINDKEIVCDEGKTILEVARENDIYIPTLCYHEGLEPYGGCRLCLVEVKGNPKLLASCSTPVVDGMEVFTETDRIKESRRFILDLLMTERNHFCMFCEKSGPYDTTDCELEKAAYEVGLDHFIFPVYEKGYKVDASSPDLVIDHNRCILCGRCVRVCDEIVANSTLSFGFRGSEALIVVDLDEERETSTCIDCGACFEACPTGAIFSKYGAYKGKKNECEKIETYCAICGIGCKATYYVKDNNVVFVEGMPLCSKGRFSYLREERERIKTPSAREDGVLKEKSWEEVKVAIKEKFATVSPQEVLILASPSLSIEELAKLEKVKDKGYELFFFEEGLFKNYKKIGNTIDANTILSSDYIIFAGDDIIEDYGVIDSYMRRAIRENKGEFVIFSNKESKLDRWATLIHRGFEMPSPNLLPGLENAKSPVLIIEGSYGMCGKILGEIEKLKEVNSNIKIMCIPPRGNGKYIAEHFVSEESGLSMKKSYKIGYVILGDYDTYREYAGFLSQNVEFLIIQASFENPLVKIADVVLPSATWYESGGTFESMMGERYTVTPFLKPPAGILSRQDVIGEVI